jgi:predicted nucleic acid-binding protein
MSNSAFVDTSAFFAAGVSKDVNHARAMEALSSAGRLVTSDHVLAETWTLLRLRVGRSTAEAFWAGIRSGAAAIEPVGVADLEVAWTIGQAFEDQDFSLIDRTSFAVMQRLGIHRAAGYDSDFAVFRFGPKRDRAFEILR